MSSLFQIAINNCTELTPIIKLIKLIFGLIQYLIPIGLILFASIDLGKAVISSDEKEVKAAQGRLIKRCIYAVAIFFIVFLVKFLMTVVSDSTESNTSKSWIKCWDNIET